MTCTSCGATIAEKAIVCYRCGAPTAVPASPRSGTTAPRGRRVWIALCVIVLIVAAVIAWWLLRTEPTEMTSLPSLLHGDPESLFTSSMPPRWLFSGR